MENIRVVKKPQTVMWFRESSEGVVQVKRKSNQTPSKSFSYGLKENGLSGADYWKKNPT